MLISSVFTVNCKKEEQKLNLSKPIENNFSITEAQNWFTTNSTKKQITSVASRLDLTNKIKSFTPLWSKALNSEDANYYVVECPVQFEKSPGFLVTDGINLNNKINGLTRLLILKNKETGNISSALMNVYSFAGNIDESINYLKQSDSFSGNIFFTDLNGEFINGWIYEKGKVIKKNKKIETNTGARLAPVSEDGSGSCQTVQTYWYERTCYFYSDGSEQCTDWIYVGTTSTTYCPTSGGSGIEVTNQESCSMTQKEARDALNEISIQRQFLNTTSIGSVVGPDEYGIIKAPWQKAWQFARLILWGNRYLEYSAFFTSTIYKLTTNPNEKWKFDQSLKYVETKITAGVFPPCGSVSLNAVITPPVISSDKTKATIILSYTAVFSISCLFGVEVSRISDTYDPYDLLAG